MAIFSNLEGTMKKILIIGKKGIRLTSSSTDLQVQNYEGTDLRPLGVATPVLDTHAVNLQYFKANSTGVANNPISHGTSLPANSFGQDGYSYYQVDDTKIVNIFMKISGVWVPMQNVTPPPEADYVEQTHVTVADWVDNTDGTYSQGISAADHGLGATPLVQIQMLDGGLVIPAIQLDAVGNITLTQNAAPVNCNVVMIGDTDMTTPYVGNVNKNQWVAVGDHFEYSVPQSVHNQASGAIFFSTYENAVDGPTSVGPWNYLVIQMQIDSASNIIFKSTKAFSGKIVVSGR